MRFPQEREAVVDNLLLAGGDVFNERGAGSLPIPYTVRFTRETPSRDRREGAVVSEPPRQHTGPRPAAAQPAVPEPTYAEQARTLVHLGRLGTLSTLSLKQAGTPFGSVTPYGLDPRGQPLFLISSMAMHTHNLQTDPRASLLVAEATTPDDALGAGRVTLLGAAHKIEKENPAELADARRRYLAAYPNAHYWVDFEDFSFYRLDVNDVYYVGGFGVMGWVTAEDYLAAEPDPLADHRQGIIDHMNADHAPALVELARQFGTDETKDVEEARMTAVDRLGFHLRLKTGDRVHGARIAFLREARSPEECRRVLVEMVRQARSA